MIPQWNCVSINENKPKTGQVLATHTWARACMTGCFTGLSRYTLLTASFHHCIRIGSNPVSFTVSPTSPVSTLKHRMANNAALRSCVVGPDVKRATRCRQEVQANTYLFELQQPNVVIIVVCPEVKNTAMSCSEALMHTADRSATAAHLTCSTQYEKALLMSC